MAIAQMHIECGPLEIDDFEKSEDKAILRSWRKFPNDPQFYKMLLTQDRIWKSFASASLKTFLLSKEAERWSLKFKRIKRRAVMEFDAPFKPTRKAALKHESQVKQILRRNPLLRYKDLKAMKIKNAQKIIEKFSPLEKHRELFLSNLKKSFASE